LKEAAEVSAEKVRALFKIDSFDAPFDLGDELLIFEAAVKAAYGQDSGGKKRRITKTELKNRLNVKLSEQRMSSLMLTCTTFPVKSRNKDGKFSFKDYEKVRKDNNDKPTDKQLDGFALAEKMENGEFDDLLEKKQSNESSKRSLTVKIAVDDPTAEQLKADPQILIDGKKIDSVPIEPWMLKAAKKAVALLKTKFGDDVLNAD